MWHFAEGVTVPRRATSHAHGSASGLPHGGGGEGSEGLLLVFPTMLEGHLKIIFGDAETTDVDI